MGNRGGRVRKDSYKGFEARDFVNIKKYDTNDMMYLNVPNYVRQTLKRKLNKYQLEKLFIELERERIDEWFRKHEKHY